MQRLELNVVKQPAGACEIVNLGLWIIVTASDEPRHNVFQRDGWVPVRVRFDIAKDAAVAGLMV